MRLGRAEVGRPRLERVRRARAGRSRAFGIGVVVEEHGDCERLRPPLARTPRGRAPPASRSAAVPPSATNGTTSSAPKRGCTPSWPDERRRCVATARPARRRGRLGVARPGPAIVNTDRWWSASACTSSERRARTPSASAREHVGVAALRDVHDALEHRRQPTADAHRSLCARCSSGSRCRSTTTRSRASDRCEFETIVDYARAAEAAGFDSVWLSDHLFLDIAKYGGPPDRVRRASSRSSTLGRARPASSPDVRLGTLVLLRGAAARGGARQGARDARPDLRRATRRRARRRLVRARVRRDRHGRCRRPGVRLARLREAVDVVDGAARPAGRSRYDGRYHRADDARRTCPAPVQQPRPRVFVGGKGDRLLAARRGARRRLEHVLDVDARRVPRAPRGARRARATAIGRDPATVWRSLGLYALVRRGRSRPRSGASSACATSSPPGVLDGVDLDGVSRRPPRRHRRPGPRAGRRVGSARRRDADPRGGRGAVPGVGSSTTSRCSRPALRTDRSQRRW